MRHKDAYLSSLTIKFYKSLVIWIGLLMVACQPILEFQVAVETPASYPVLGKVAYIQGGDVWIVDLDKATTIRLTQDGYNAHPEWSPDGTEIAFLKKGQLWILDLNTNQTNQVSEITVEWFTWSMSGDQIIYFNNSKGLIKQNVANNVETTIIPVSTSTSFVDFIWDKHGEALVFSKGIVKDGKYLVSLETTNITQDNTVTISSTTNLLELQLPAKVSPEGPWIAFWQWNTEITFPEKVGLPICIVSPSGGNAYCTASKTVPSSEFLDWSYDNKLALFTIDNKLSIVDSGNPSEQDLIALPNQSPIYPSWSPDGKSIGFSAMSVKSKNSLDIKNQNVTCIERRIWSIEVDSKKLQQLTEDGNYCDDMPLWSTDGKYLLFARLNKDNASLWLISANGDRLNQVVPELTPKPEPFGEYGYIDWPALYDWWRPYTP